MAAETAKTKAAEDIETASKVIQRASKDIADAEEAMQKEGISVSTQDELLQKISADMETLKTNERKTENSIMQAEENKNRAAEEMRKAGIPAENYCAPKPMDPISLRNTMSGFIHPHYHGAYFHQIGCDEDTLRNVCWNFVSMSRAQLEDFLRPGRGSYNCRHNFHPYMICDDGRRHPAEYDVAQMSLQNRLEEERYYGCLQRRPDESTAIINKANADIAAAEANKQEAEKTKRKITEDIKELEAELTKVTATKQELLKQKMQLEKGKVDAEIAKKQKETDITTLSTTKESLAKEIAATTTHLEKLAIDLSTAKLAKARADEKKKTADEIIEKARVDIEELEKNITAAETALRR